MRIHDSKICELGRLYDPLHATCKSCPVGCAMKSISKIAGKAPKRVAEGKTEGKVDNTLTQPKKSSHRPKLEVLCPKEDAEQVSLAQFLDLMFWDEWFHSPNEGKKTIGYHMKMKRQGLKSGIPDVLLFRPTPSGAPGVAIELKRIKSGTVSVDQKKWLKTLENFGWVCYVGLGATASIQFIKEIYGI